ncbi:dihydrofolate reductase family protein [Microlunatus flavus]|uniref:Dihydrofolate reductase n=1 Tax=Microlunatus flavus TaxID=1036181 RepID=A0A1H9L7X8_9ACTN|nr:dihydrofolate reductase family protein [Microlunatus flavus]SER07546.1 Dihydrofolate reductase [Microlunatus flavus]
MSQTDYDRSEGQSEPPTRKVVGGYFLSLDGVAEAPDQFITAWDDEVDASGAALIANQDTVILGRRTYDEWVTFWPGSDIEPFASFINAVPKYVATSTPLEPAWAESQVIEGNVVELVRHLKSQPGGEIGVHGSISVARTLLGAGLLDELRLVIAPTVAAAGKRLLTDLSAMQLEVLRGTTSPSGYLLVDYRVLPPAAAA